MKLTKQDVELFVKNNWKTIGTILIVIPVCIYALSVIPLFPSGENNDWAGFWGGYLGAIIGGGITLYVMWKTNEEARENLEKTLNHEKEISLQEEKREFCNDLILKHSNWAESLEQMITQASLYIAHSENMSKIECVDEEQIMRGMNYMLEYSKQLTRVKTLNYELYMHFGVKKNQKGFDSELSEELYKMFGDFHDLLQQYHQENLKGDINTKNINKEFEDFSKLSDDITEKIMSYIKELLYEEC